VDLAKYFKFAPKRSKNKLASKNAMTPDKTYLGEGGGEEEKRREVSSPN